MKTLSARKRLFRQRRFRWLLAILMVLSIFLGVIIVPLERSLGNITNYFDGIWWAVSTVTTVGYGDYVPVTDSGKVVGILLQIVGAVMFGIVIAMISNYINRSQDEFYWNRLFERMDRIEIQLDELKRRTGYMVKNGKHLEEKEKENASNWLGEEPTRPRKERQKNIFRGRV